MNFEYLIDTPDKIPQIAKWYYEEWGKHDGKTIESIEKRLHTCLNKSSLPLAIVGLKDGELISIAKLQLFEMDIYPDKEHWLGGVYVKESYRGQGIGKLLIDKMISEAKSLKISKLYLETEELTGGIYNQSGFKHIEKTIYNGVEVAIMANQLL